MTISKTCLLMFVENTFWHVVHVIMRALWNVLWCWLLIWNHTRSHQTSEMEIITWHVCIVIWHLLCGFYKWQPHINTIHTEKSFMDVSALIRFQYHTKWNSISRLQCYNLLNPERDYAFQFKSNFSKSL